MLGLVLGNDKVIVSCRGEPCSLLTRSMWASFVAWLLFCKETVAAYLKDLERLSKSSGCGDASEFRESIYTAMVQRLWLSSGAASHKQDQNDCEKVRGPVRRKIMRIQIPAYKKRNLHDCEAGDQGLAIPKVMGAAQSKWLAGIPQCINARWLSRIRRVPASSHLSLDWLRKNLKAISRLLESHHEPDGKSRQA